MLAIEMVLEEFFISKGLATFGTFTGGVRGMGLFGVDLEFIDTLIGSGTVFTFEGAGLFVGQFMFEAFGFEAKFFLANIANEFLSVGKF